MAEEVEDPFLIVLCDQPNVVPKERVEISVELPAEFNLINMNEEFLLEKPKKKRKVTSSKLEIKISLVSVATSVTTDGLVDPKVKIDAFEPKSVGLPLQTAESKVVFTGRIDFDPRAIGLSSCMACIEVAASVREQRITGQTKPFRLCNYQLFYTEVKPTVVEGGVSYSINCALITYENDESKVANRPIRVSVIDDSGLSIPEGQSTWYISDSNVFNNPAKTPFTNKVGDLLFNVFVAEGSAHITLLGGVIRFHISCDWMQSPDLFATVPACSRRFCPENDRKENSTVPSPDTIVRKSLGVMPPPPPLMEEIILQGGNVKHVVQCKKEKDRTTQSRNGRPQKEVSLLLEEEDHFSNSIANMDDKSIRRLGWFPYDKEGKVVYCRQCFACKSRFSQHDKSKHRQTCNYAKDSFRINENLDTIIPDLASGISFQAEDFDFT
mmetsp:Transcript_19612/g.29796  ORF Transcript_19612/g.29796 Transcript_19612/m.29796 type:complete len:439 (-) Transcript_19612:3057-4373(-)